MSPGLADRVCRWAVARAARRWPGDLAETMRAEWTAELDAMRTGPLRKAAFAGSLLCSPAVEEEGADEPARPTTAIALALGVTLLAGLLFNLVHAGYHRSGGRPVGLLLLLAAVGVMAAAARWSRAAAVPAAVLIGAGMFAFLMAGNQVAVMPFMGWVDTLPAVVTWAALTVPVAHCATRLTAAGRRRAAVAVAAGGGLVALDLAAIAGSAHAARVLGLGFGTGPGWFPLSLLPGDTAAFGRYFADGTASFGRLQASGPAFHASDILLGNASAMIGPLALCSAFVLTLAVRTQAGLSAVRWPARRRGITGGLAGLIVCEAIRRSGSDAALDRIVDNSAVFGFGFVTHRPGQVAVALLIGLMVTRLLEAPVPRREG